MTEAEWLASTDRDEMLAFAHAQAGARKLRLFACACCRRIWHHLPDEHSRQVVQVAERFADGLASMQELAVARNSARDDGGDTTEFPIGDAAKISARKAARNIARNAARLAASEDPANAAADTAGAVCWYMAACAPDKKAEKDAALAAEQKAQAELLRELFHPFWRGSMPDQWPPDVLAAARALYEAGDKSSTLREALMTAGQAELAQHFQVPKHPRGCWALDLILGLK